MTKGQAEMSETTIHLPQGKLIRTGDERYRLTEPADLPADKLEPVAKQATRMRKLTCPVCGTVLRGTAKYKRRVLTCAGDGAAHTPTIMIWADADAPILDTPDRDTEPVMPEPVMPEPVTTDTELARLLSEYSDSDSDE